MKSFASLLVLFAALTASSQEVRVGGLEGNGAVFASSAGTIIDWTRPAAATGSLTTASVAWIDASVPCDNIFYVRFYAIPSNALVTVMTAERGPFRAVNGINTVALEPAVSVTSETYIGAPRAGAGQRQLRRLHDRESHTHRVPANYFIQTGASAFIDNAELPPGGKIVVLAYEKELYVYGSVTDKRTNDPGMRIGLD